MATASSVRFEARVLGAVQSAREAEPELSAEEVVTLVADTAGLAPREVRAALAYWADYADEVEALLRQARAEADQAFTRWEREHELLGT
jgi:metal-dependent HD superfamily phosphatase/phosphodiesterase